MVLPFSLRPSSPLRCPPYGVRRTRAHEISTSPATTRSRPQEQATSLPCFPVSDLLLAHRADAFGLAATVEALRDEVRSLQAYYTDMKTTSDALMEEKEGALLSKSREVNALQKQQAEQARAMAEASALADQRVARVEELQGRANQSEQQAVLLHIG
mmetsp:Transcript_36474/g.59616  ORF Transcript_36474/g.59616 Transcript_36474/m.59616 type:complete len:157 (+) Transcript_36474:319-789(+)